MDILVYGAGVCGSYLASELFFAKHNVTLLARGERLEFLRENGVIIKHNLQKNWTTAKVPVIAKLTPEAHYDVVLIVLKKTDLKGALPVLEANKKCPLYIFLGNNGDIKQVCKSFSDASRLAFGFPASGGKIDKGIVYSYHADRPELTLGETLGSESTRLSRVASLFKSTAIKVEISPHIDAWLKYRLAIINPMAAAIQWADGDVKKLASSAEMVDLMIAAIKEGFKVLEALGYPSEPPSAIRSLQRHKALVAFNFKRIAAKESSKLAIRDLAMNAPGEMAALSADFQSLKTRSGIETPAIDKLYALMLRPEA
jgi:2-dehydropantoate 2-reductase